jgi:hypothetical protein
VSHATEGAYDLADGTRTCFAANGTYSTYLFARRAVEIIRDAAAARAAPFFLYLAFQVRARARARASSPKLNPDPLSVPRLPGWG